MGPIEKSLINQAKEVRCRLLESKSESEGAQKLIAEIAWLRSEVARLTDEVRRLRPTYDTSAISKVLEVVSIGEKVSKLDLLSVRRTKKVALVRQICFYLAATRTKHSLVRIGRFFNKKDHTTVLYGVNKIAMLRLVDDKIDQRLKLYENQLDC